MHKRFFPLLVLLLGNLVPAAAQMPAAQVVPKQDRIERIVTWFLRCEFHCSRHPSCCPTIPENPLPISVTCTPELTKVIRAWMT